MSSAVVTAQKPASRCLLLSYPGVSRAGCQLTGRSARSRANARSRTANGCRQNATLEMSTSVSTRCSVLNRRAISPRAHRVGPGWWRRPGAPASSRAEPGPVAASPARSTCLEDREVALGEPPVGVLLVQHDAQALPDGLPRRRPVGVLRAVRDGVELLVGQPIDHVTDHRLDLCAHLEHLVERRADLPVTRDLPLLGGLVPGEPQRVPGAPIA